MRSEWGKNCKKKEKNSEDEDIRVKTKRGWDAFDGFGELGDDSNNFVLVWEFYIVLFRKEGIYQRNNSCLALLEND